MSADPHKCPDCGYEGAEADLAEYAAYLFENPGARRVWLAREENLARYRGVVAPGEEITSRWIESIESRISAFGRQSE